MEYISYCGIKCSKCPIYTATVNNDDSLREKLMADYSNELCSFSKEDMNCRGCRSDIARESRMCGGCEIRICAEPRNVLTCAECKEYPCGIIEKYVPADGENRKTLDMLHTN